jgi:hypothetical protein
MWIRFAILRFSLRGGAVRDTSPLDFRTQMKHLPYSPDAHRHQQNRDLWLHMKV